jgi:aspartyl protease family protein
LKALAAAATLLLPQLAPAADVKLIGVTPGRSALVVIDGSGPIKLGIGETAERVTLVRADSDSAVLRVDGVTQTLHLEAYDGGGGGVMSGGTVRLSADARGHFFANATVNGRSMRFIVDTGASLTTLSEADAKRIGLRYRGGSKVRTSTANGIVDGWRVSLDSVSIGNVTVYDVDAMVLDTDLRIGLLGMSFLDRFNMQRQGTTLVLEQRR